ncbi:formimidoylglutamate deiminase [Sphingobium yanoikuyae]|uniref:Formimidoylglutamate deiminase n=1 Tax=Sphingobium yanoikuyae TaxID=13690 RepID=A0A291MXN4_SPHYA|nr:formimidoylglutamate deiminase [Sphingobium yanoikuyae]ATI79705.1 formimidoylglutamate deiminase [Sphingobium yanoikuyae]
MTSLFFDHVLLPQEWARDVRMMLHDGAIGSIEQGTSPQAEDIRHAVALPGLPNLHSHAFQRAMAGLTEVRGPAGDSFWTWRDLMYRFVGRMDPDDIAAIAAQAYVEMLESGFTRVGEFHYLHHAADGAPYANPAETSLAIMAAAAESGIGLTLLPVFYAWSGFGAQPPSAGQRRFAHDLDGFARLREAAITGARALPDAVVGVAPHSLRAVAPDELALLARIAGHNPVHIHIAEQQKEVADCIAWSGQRPVEWLLDHAPVSNRWCLVHATHMTRDEARAMAASGAAAGLCPITEANLGDGIFPAEPFLDAGGVYGVGSDSNVRIDATEELRLLEYGQRLGLQQRNVLARQAGMSTGDGLYRAAVAGGAQALGVAAGLRVGASADFVTLDLDHPSLAHRPVERLLDGLIFGAGRDAIDTVWRRGVQMVSGGRHRAREVVATRYRRTLEKLTA